MSFDVYLMAHVDGLEPVAVCEVGNITYNLSPMFVECLNTEGEGLRGLHGRVAANALPIVIGGLHSMLMDPDKYKAMNPSNGWGDYHVALQFLFNMAKVLGEYPGTTIHIS